MAGIAGNRILLADSGKDTAELTRQLLMREGAYILTVNTVEAFLRGMDTMAPPELVVMAMELQGSTGLQATISLRAHPRWMRTPLVLIGSQADGADIKQAFQAGADDYVRKPLSPIELVARVERLLTRTSSH